MTITLDEWRKAGRSFKHRGHDIFYRDEGGAGDDVLLLIHGFPTSSWDWAPMWPALVNRFRVIAPDMIGFGFSDKPVDYAYSIIDQAQLIEDLLASLNIKRVYVLAHDYGDTVAQELLARFNERPTPRTLELRSVCFLNGGLFPERHRARLIQKLLNSRFGEFVAKLSSERTFRRSFTAIFSEASPPTDDELKDFWAVVHEKDGEKIFHKLIKYIDERKANRERWVGALVHSKVRLRLIDGAADPISGEHMAARYGELVKDADIHMLDEVGHYPQLEVPKKVLAKFLDFIDPSP